MSNRARENGWHGYGQKKISLPADVGQRFQESAQGTGMTYGNFLAALLDNWDAKEAEQSQPQSPAPLANSARLKEAA